MSTILIVDDEAPLREILALVLKDAGHRILLATHGRQALELVDRDRPDLIISDVMMPVLSGSELCRRLKHSASTRAIPIILMSSAGRQTTLGTGADAFFDKPFEINAVEDLVRYWLGRPGPG